ncbi:MAG: D-beta-D-heptose 7-phosphate kinase / D-beta-D-heptose 1-phosphate adenosyltransferase [Gaiellales bacterium]|nr:D-beta-D-heptose 7-phosphate kinase / D-beta-D-heptose 1-phosphate adenosyltransferase [Gaiellales bacterium]
MNRVVVVGDALLDCDVEVCVERLCPDAPVPVLEESGRRLRPGGAALAACLLRRDGYDVALVCALGADEAGSALSALLAGEGIEVLDLALRGGTPEKVRMRCEARTLMRLDRGSKRPATSGPLGARARSTLAGASGVLVSDYGYGIAARPDVRHALAELAAKRPLLWDPHPAGPVPVPRARLATPNASEAAGFDRADTGEAPGIGGVARRLVRTWLAEAVAVTLGSSGAVVCDAGGRITTVPATRSTGTDACGAGDRFAGAALAALLGGADVTEAVAIAVATASGFVASGGAAHVPPAASADTGEAPDAIARVRRNGGVVVATGGCFDLIHAGHVSMLEAARALGHSLVVCLNSDSSVARLKGADRPIVNQEDRADVLRALRCVDAVEIFEEDTPVRLLQRLRPDVFVKGGDYGDSEIAEERVMRALGGRVAFVPYLAERSTTRLIRQVLADA